MKLQSFKPPIHALVQGGSGGIGLAFARSLLGDPNVARVFTTSRNPHASVGLKALAEEEPDRLTALTMDVTEEGSVESAANTVAASTPRIDLLIYCAGVLHDEHGMRPERRLADVEPANLLRSYQVNAIGALLVAKHFQRLFDRSERCVLASLSARVGSIGDNRLGGWYGYRASKAAQNMITRNLSIELRRRSKGIICVGLHPGTVDTPLSKPFQSGVPEGRLFSAERAAGQLLQVIDSLTAESNGCFYAWDGREIVW